ncbi:MAG: amidase [Legionellales bacterium]|nr:amidase [Legionellales bacterium]
MIDLTAYDGLGIAELIRDKILSAEEVLQATILQCEKINPRINAISQKLYDFAYQSLKKYQPESIFAGVPCLLKDLSMDLQGYPTSSGNPFFATQPAPVTSHIVKRYLEAGFIILGKTNVPEFGIHWTTESTFLGVCRNPWDVSLSAGGSSGGSAAAVASGMVTIASASDAGGSIRVPAALCGCLGLKPSRGRISFSPHPDKGWHQISVLHAITRSVRDSAALLDIACGNQPGDKFLLDSPAISFSQQLTLPLKPLKIAVDPQSPLGGKVSPICQQALINAVNKLLTHGHHIEEAQLSYPHFTTMEARFTLTAKALAKSFIEYGIKESMVEPLSWEFAQYGSTLTMQEFFQAAQEIEAASHTVHDFFKDYDIYLTPMLAAPQLKLNELIYQHGDPLAFYRDITYSFTPFTLLANNSGIPAISVPIFLEDYPTPLAVQLMSGIGQEGKLLQLALQLAEQQPWPGAGRS